MDNCEQPVDGFEASFVRFGIRVREFGSKSRPATSSRASACESNHGVEMLLGAPQPLRRHRARRLLPIVKLRLRDWLERHPLVQSVHDDVYVPPSASAIDDLLCTPDAPARLAVLTEGFVRLSVLRGDVVH